MLAKSLIFMTIHSSASANNNFIAWKWLASKIGIIIHSQRVQKSIIFNFKSLHSQFQIFPLNFKFFALFGINCHALGQSESRNYSMYIINTGKRTEWSLIRSVIISYEWLQNWTIMKWEFNLLITRMITNRHRMKWSPLTN